MSVSCISWPISMCGRRSTNCNRDLQTALIPDPNLLWTGANLPGRIGDSASNSAWQQQKSVSVSERVGIWSVGPWNGLSRASQFCQRAGDVFTAPQHLTIRSSSCLDDSLLQLDAYTKIYLPKGHCSISIVATGVLRYKCKRRSHSPLTHRHKAAKSYRWFIQAGKV